MTSAIRLTKSNCIHYWVIEPSHKVVFHPAPNGADGEGEWKPYGSRSPGVCVYNAELNQGGCGETRMFRNTTPQSRALT